MQNRTRASFNGGDENASTRQISCNPLFMRESFISIACALLQLKGADEFRYRPASEGKRASRGGGAHRLARTAIGAMARAGGGCDLG